MTPYQFLLCIQPEAEACAQETNFPLAALLAIPALETGWGTMLTQGEVYTYNLFNVKGEGPAGSVEIRSIEWLSWEEWERLRKRGIHFILTGRVNSGRLEGTLNQRYRVYTNFGESYSDFQRLLRSQPRYAPVYHAQDPFQFCRALQETGFATDPQYAEKLHSIIRKRVMPFLEEQPNVAHLLLRSRIDASN